MKKMIVLMLGLILALGLGVVACGGGTTETTIAVTTTEASNAVDWTTAADYEGQAATITGTVAAVDNKFKEKGIPKILIRVGGPQTSPHFNIVIELAADGTVPLTGMTTEMVEGLVGKTVEITGAISLNAYDTGAYETFLTDPSALVIK